MKLHFKYIVALALISLLSSCMTNKNYIKTTHIDESLYRADEVQDTLNMADLSWQDFFSDEQLKKLIDTGLKNNLDLKIGLERIHKAQSLLAQSKGAFFPQLFIDGGVKQSRMAYPQSFGFVENATTYEIGLRTAWEIDLWGKLKNGKKAAVYKLLREESIQQAVQTELIAQTADYYYQLLALDEQVHILETTIGVRKEEAETMKKLKEANIVTAAAVAQSEAGYLEAENQLPAVQRQIRAIENALNVLLGQSPATVSRSTFKTEPLFPDVHIGVPVQLLRNRPDVQAAEFELASYFEEINVARKAFYPSLTINASSGFTNFGIANWFTPSGFFANVGGGLLQPVFSKRLNKTRLELAKSDYREKELHFRKTVLVAGQEVSDALFNYHSASGQEQQRSAQLGKLEQALEHTRKLLLYHNSTNYTDVLTARQALLSAQLQMTNERLLKYQSLIYLYRALGGGVQSKENLILQ
ncbi:efflux transporter, outer membrane factor (OMF) lipoprotein, NodT family [Paenimyroides ummariense]|uniref:Efflux transporter, outer membrane factor (OMF) lipoprotein, NodT family n=1 Tax=Paenimyroides ummariense TaxID=913024 RepID=A0A1I4X6X6_9FLAO|nr:TolC family protein [Paenimyroides ummariense]SFN21110.1 efflux transporter, outer membrane factor (OMF) lipoprotein, NodT family [Paenimyroides ummariense]